LDLVLRNFEIALEIVVDGMNVWHSTTKGPNMSVVIDAYQQRE